MTAAPERGPEPARPSTSVERWLGNQIGVEIADLPTGRVISLPRDLAQRVNMLTPASQVVQVDASYSPIPKVVQLDIKEHAYEEKNAGKGKFALNAKGLALLSEAGGIQLLDPLVDYMGGAGVAFTARARRRGPDGTWDLRTATKVVRFAQLERKARRERRASIDYHSGEGKAWAQKLLADPVALEAELVKYVDDILEHIDAKTQTKAVNRVVRHWLAVKSTYTPQELTKPFLCITWVVTPDYSNPHVGKVIEANFQEGRKSLYAVDAEEPARGELAAAAADEDEPGFDDETGEVVDGTAHEPAGDELEADFDDAPAQDPAPPGEGEMQFSLDGSVADDAVPPKPHRSMTFRRGRFEGMHVGAVVEDPEGMLWVAEQVAKMRANATRALLVDWLSYAEGIYLGFEDMAALVERVREGLP